MLIRKRQSIKATSIFFYRKIVLKNRSFYFTFSVLKLSFGILYTASGYSGPPFYYGSYISAQDTSLPFRFQSEYIGFYRYLVIRKVAMCQFGTSDESFQNHHLAGTRVTVKFALRAGPARRAC
jgi:uncharacterized membrane protein